MKNIVKLLGVLMLLFIVLPAMAQGAGAPPATPIDGGLSLLLAAGGIYGLKKLRGQQRKD